MAICSTCQKEMMVVGNGCIIEPIVIEGTKYDQVPFDGDVCHDCNVTTGQFHHPGCDMERCPRCHEQLISCGCLDDADDIDGADDEEDEE